MPPANGGAAFFRFSTDDLPPRERAAAVREMHERCPLPAKPEPQEPLSDQRLRVDITQRVLPGLGILSGDLSGVRQLIQPERSAPTRADDVILNLDSAGTTIITRRGDDVVLRNGGAVVATRGATGFSVARKSVRFISVRFPLTALSPLVPHFDLAEVRVLPGGSAALMLLRRYLGLITQESALATPELQRAAVAHVHELAALALGAGAEGAELERNRGVRAARLEAVKADIISHLNDGNLSFAEVAGRQRLAPRYMQKLFEADGTSFSEFVLGQRLAKAYRMLTNPLYARRPIGILAYDSGFNDLSYFNRAFRRRYGSTPSDVRHGR